MSKESTDTLIVLIGDQEQPTRAAPLRTKQLVLRRLLKNQPGLRAPLLRFRPPFEYISNLVDFYKTNSAVPEEDIAAALPQVHTLGHFNLYALIKLRTSAGPNRALTNHERLGWGGLGGLTIPFSLRNTDQAYLLNALTSYQDLFPTWEEHLKQSDSFAGHLAPFGKIALETRLVDRPNYGPAMLPLPPYRTPISIEISKTSERLQSTTEQPKLPSCTPEAKKRLHTAVDYTTTMQPITVLLWKSPSPSPYKFNHHWLHAVQDVLLGAIAVVMSGMRQSNDGPIIGVFCPWLNVVTRLHSVFTPTQWKGEVAEAECPKKLTATLLGKKRGSVDSC